MTRGPPQLLRNLQQVAHDRLIAAGILVDRLGDLRFRSSHAALGPIGRKRRSRKAQPQIGICRWLPGLDIAATGHSFVDDPKTIEHERLQFDVRPLRDICLEPQWPVTVGLCGQCTERLAKFQGVDAGHDADRADVMLVQRVRETTKDGLIGIGRDTIDDQLAARNAEGDVPTIRKELFAAPEDRFNGRNEGRVSGRVHRLAMQGDRELDEELVQVTRQRSPLGSGGSLHRLPAD